MKNFFLLTIFITLTICANAQKRLNFELGAGMTQNSGNIENISLKNYAELERNDIKKKTKKKPTKDLMPA